MMNKLTKISVLAILTAALAACGSQPEKPAESMRSERSQEFKAVSIDSVEAGKVCRLISDGWMLITAGDTGSFNTMTASWGELGSLWGKHVATMFIRPQRYTKEFVDREEIFTLAFFDEQYREALNICGTLSGRDGDKVKKAGLTPVTMPSGSVAFEEAYLVVECRKLYAAPFSPENFIDTALRHEIYPEKDFHTMYIGEIVGVHIRE